MAVADWSTDPSQNTDIGGINIAEGCPSGNLNNAQREMMAQLKAYLSAFPADIQPKNANLTALSGLVGAADQIPYFTGPGATALAYLSPFIRTLMLDTDAIGARTRIGAVGVAALQLSNPGYIRFQYQNLYPQIAWGTATFAPNAGTNIIYAANFLNASFPIVSAGNVNAGEQDNGPFVVGNGAAQNGFSAYSSLNVPVSGYYIAVGY